MSTLRAADARRSADIARLRVQAGSLTSLGCASRLGA